MVSKESGTNYIFSNRFLKQVVAGLVTAACIYSCRAPEDFPIVPNIGFDQVIFKDLTDQPDSLILFIDFEDGDGDLGLNRDENDYPYQDFDFVVDEDGRIVTLSATDTRPPYYQFAFESGQNPDKISDTDNRPVFSCDNYDFLFINEDRNVFIPKGTKTTDIDLSQFHLDTLFVVKNENRNNIFVDFFRKRGSNYEFIDWKRAFDENGCGIDFNARFPIFDVQSLNSSLEGTIKYSMTSSGFNVLIRTDTFKLRVKIKDRRLHDSNVIETGDLTLESLK
ncbi:MAG: hypothetical protein RIG77_14785 [Cyclobacteriaceae bacterium]